MKNATIGGCSCNDGGEQKKSAAREYMGDAVREWEGRGEESGDDE